MTESERHPANEHDPTASRGIRLRLTVSLLALAAGAAAVILAILLVRSVLS